MKNLDELHDLIAAGRFPDAARWVNERDRKDLAEMVLRVWSYAEHLDGETVLRLYEDAVG